MSNSWTETKLGGGLPDVTKTALKQLGHTLEPSAMALGDAKIIVRDKATGEAWGFSDEREGGLAAGPKAEKRQK